ncbi:MAG: GGDEF domain-containing protein [Deltaproteobacteria bacterium]|nr:GGDEF domain-containing protein [Deltaproteobacteria bacterium]
MKRPRIGVLIDAVHEQYQSGIWRGICHQAAECNVDLLSFAGTSQDGVDHFDAHYDIIEQFAPNSDIDGAIVFTGSIAEHHGREFTQKLCESFRGIPLVCVSEKIEGFPSILVENAPGVERMVAHFVEVHDYRDIVFIRGPKGHEEAEQRFEAYKRAMAANGVKFKPDLILNGSFIGRDGATAIRELIERGVHFDAVICVNDNTALGVLEELIAQGRHVPGKVALAGFDDVEEAANIDPALTTVRQPMYQMGIEAVNHVLSQIAGEKVPMETVLATEPVFRRSCGCFSDEVANARAVHSHIAGLSKEEIADQLMVHILPLVNTTSSNYAGEKVFRQSILDLIQALVWDVQKHNIRYIFLNEVDMFLFNVGFCCDGVALLTLTLRELTAYIPSLFDKMTQQAHAENLLQQGNELLHEHRARSERQTLIQERQFQRNINVVSQRIISSFEQRELLESIARGLPQLNVNSLVLAVFNQDSINRTQWKYTEKCELMLAYNHHTDVVVYPRGCTQIPTRSIFLEGLLQTEKLQNHIFMPLYHRDEYLGYVVLEYTDSAPLFMYEELREHISSVVKSSMLLRRFKAQSMLDELTGVYNRRGFVDLGNKMLNSARNVGLQVMMFYADVDGLKGINDTFGHEDGDLIISAAAQVLTETFRDRDIIARIGGDEFVVVLVSEKVEGLEKKIRKRFARFEREFNEKLGKRFKLSVSLGTAVCSESQGETLEMLMKRADADLFAKKRARKLALVSIPPPATD